MTARKCRALAAAAAGLALAACGGSPSGAASPPPTPAPTPSPAPTRDPSKDSLPLLADVSLGASPHSFQGGDDHVTISLDNRGRDLQDVVIHSPRWVDEHGLAMGATRSCIPDPAAGTIHCGPVFAGQSASFNLRALPATAGTFHYVMRLYDAEGGALLPIALSDGRPAEFAFDEVVDPVTKQIQGINQTPPPSP